MTDAQKLAISILTGHAPADTQDAPGKAPSAVPADGSLQIVVLDRGFVYVGHVHPGNGHIRIENAQNVRRWGTTRGLGELAERGPLPETKLDPAGTVIAPLHAVNHLIACKSDQWKI